MADLTVSSTIDTLMQATTAAGARTAIGALAAGDALGTPASGTLTNCTFPTLNQNTTGSAATLTTPRTINGVSFNGSANITVTAAGSTLSDTVPVGKGGTGLTALGTGLQVLRTNSGATAMEWATVSTGGGDVTAASAFGTDGLMIVSDGTGKGVKSASTVAAATVTTLTVTNAIASLPATTIELGHASDTSLTRVSAGVMAVEGKAVVTVDSVANHLGTHASPDTTGGALTWTAPVYEVFTDTTTTYALPATAGYVNKAVMFYVTGTNAITIDPNGSEVIVRDGTAQTGGVTMTLTGAAGNYVSMICDGVRWITLGFKGTLAAGA